MSPSITLFRLRRLLLAITAWLYLGTIAELIAAGHYEGRLQLIPFGLCTIGLLALVGLWTELTPRMTMAVRGAMIVIALGSLFGMYEHIQGNYVFAQEVHPGASQRELVEDTLTGGNPILAPGIFLFATMLTVTATLATVSGSQSIPERDRSAAITFADTSA